MADLPSARSPMGLRRGPQAADGPLADSPGNWLLCVALPPIHAVVGHWALAFFFWTRALYLYWRAQADSPEVESVPCERPSEGEQDVQKYPIIAITGSQRRRHHHGQTRFEHVFRREQINPWRSSRVTASTGLNWQRSVRRVEKAEGRRQPPLFRYFPVPTRICSRRSKTFRPTAIPARARNAIIPLHNDEEAAAHNQGLGTDSGSRRVYTLGGHRRGYRSHVLRARTAAWSPTRLDVARWWILLVGGCRSSTLEWIQKIHRDTAERGYSGRSGGGHSSCGACRTT